RPPQRSSPAGPRAREAVRRPSLAAGSPRRLKHLSLPFKPKKRSLASDAKEKRLEPLAMAMWNRDPAVANLAEVLPGMIDPWKQLHDVEQVTTGVKYILADVIADAAEVRGPLRNYIWDLGLIVAAKAEGLPEGKGKEYDPY